MAVGITIYTSALLSNIPTYGLSYSINLFISQLFMHRFHLGTIINNTSMKIYTESFTKLYLNI